MDDDDKVRRNLIATSAIIIAVAWFDVSLPDLLERLFSVKGTPASGKPLADWKVWIAALVVLCYLAWRFRWSDEVERARKQFADSVQERYGVLFQRVYLRNVAKWIQAGRIPKDAHPQMPVFFNLLTPQMLVDQLGGKRPTGVTLRAREGAFPTNGNESVEGAATWTTPSGGQHENVVQAHVYIDLRRQRALVWRARGYAAVNSRESLSLFWPMLIAGAAFAIVIYKLVLSLV
jgi:hypothetical protein